MLDLDTDNLVQLYQSGKTVTEISFMFGVDKGTIAIRLKRAGIDLKAGSSAAKSKAAKIRREKRHTELVRLYTDGTSTRELSEMFGVPQGTIARQLTKMGVDVKVRQYADRLPPSNVLKLPETEITKLFQDGMSTKALAEMFGCSRRAIDKRLEDAGIDSRTSSQSMFLRMKNTTKEQRQELTKAAHAAVKGKRQSFEELCKRALERQSSTSLHKLNRRELLFYSLAAEAGITLIPQYAVGPYNADFRVHELPITVEIYSNCSSGHTCVPYKRERLKYFLDRGYAVITVVNVRQLGISAECIEQVKSFVEQVSRDETKLGKEYVVAGDGHIRTRRR